MGLTYGIYGDLCFCGLEPMGFIGFYVIAVWDLWDSHGAMGLRCGTYGTAVWDLLDSHGSMGLR